MSTEFRITFYPDNDILTLRKELKQDVITIPNEMVNGFLAGVIAGALYNHGDGEDWSAANLDGKFEIENLSTGKKIDFEPWTYGNGSYVFVPITEILDPYDGIYDEYDSDSESWKSYIEDRVPKEVLASGTMSAHIGIGMTLVAFFPEPIEITGQKRSPFIEGLASYFSWSACHGDDLTPADFIPGVYRKQGEDWVKVLDGLKPVTA